MGLSKKRMAVGVDFGGTSVKMAVVDEDGVIRSRTTVSTTKAATQEAWLDAVASGMEKMKDDVGGRGDDWYVGMGVGVPGFVDCERGYIYDLPNVSGWTGVFLAELIEQRFAVPGRVDNDVNVMALGESTFGAGAVYDHAVFLTLGTGVGGALIINNALYRGAHSMAGEIGHMSIMKDGIKSPQGRGGLEQYIGNRRIMARTVRELKKGRRSIIRTLVDGDMERVTPKVIAQAASQGDKLGLEVFDFVADCLASALASVTYLLQPQVFIIGGGVSLSGAVLFDPLRKHLNERLSPFFAERVELKPAKLGNDAGVIGSATMAMSLR